MRKFLDCDVDGFVNLCINLGWEIMKKLDESKLYNMLTIRQIFSNISSGWMK